MMSTTGLYQILVDLGANKEQVQKALETLACEGQVATKADLANLENRLIRWMATIAAILFIALGFLIRLP